MHDYTHLPGHLTLVNKSAGVIRRIFIDNLGKLAKSRQKHRSNQLHTSCYTLHTIPYRRIKFVFNAFHTKRLLSFPNLRCMVTVCTFFENHLTPNVFFYFLIFVDCLWSLYLRRIDILFLLSQRFSFFFKWYGNTVCLKRTFFCCWSEWVFFPLENYFSSNFLLTKPTHSISFLKQIFLSSL